MKYVLTVTPGNAISLRSSEKPPLTTTQKRFDFIHSCRITPPSAFRNTSPQPGQERSARW